MKTILTAGTAAALAIGVMLTAPAHSKNSSEGDSTHTATLTPIASRPLAYPETALRYAREGECTVRFTIHTEGHVSGVQAIDCSEPVFAAEAMRYASSLRYAPNTVESPFAHELTIHWRGLEPENRATS